MLLALSDNILLKHECYDDMECIHVRCIFKWSLSMTEQTSSAQVTLLNETLELPSVQQGLSCNFI